MSSFLKSFAPQQDWRGPDAHSDRSSDGTSAQVPQHQALSVGSLIEPNSGKPLMEAGGKVVNSFGAKDRVGQSFSRRNPDGSSKDSISVFCELVSGESTPVTPNRKSKICRDFSKGSCSYGSKCKFEHTSPKTTTTILDKPEPKKEPERVEHFLVRSTVHGALYEIPQTATPYLTQGDLEFYKDYHMVDGDIVECKAHGYGWYTVSSDPFKNTLKVSVRPATVEVHMDGYRWKDENNSWVHVEPRTYRVFEPLFAKLNKSFKSSRLEAAVLNAITVHSTLEYGEHAILTETREYYKHLIVKRYYASIQSTDSSRIIANNSEVIGKGSEGYVKYLDNGLVLEDYFSPWQIEDVECELPLTWTVRKDFKVIKSNNVQLTNGQRSVDFTSTIFESNENDTPYFRFRDTRTRARHRTCFFKLGGLGIPDFLEYANTANNLTHGLKRLLGSKENELMLRNNAIRLGAHIAKLLESDSNVKAKKIFKMLVGARHGRQWTETDNYCKALLENLEVYNRGTRYNCEYVRFTEDPLWTLREQIAKQYHQLWVNCNRSRIQKFIDYINTAGNWCYYGMYVFLLENFASLFSREALAQIDHVKRKLRMRYVNGALLNDDDNVMVDKVEVLIKRELAKFGKAPRVYANYDSGCVYANEIPEYVKVGIEGKHFYSTELASGGRLTTIINVMAKPRPDSLETIFTDMHNALQTPNFLYFAIYSDDMCMAGQINRYRMCYNLDIESNDSSQDVPAFMAVHGCCSNFSYKKSKGLLQQCMKPLLIASPQDPSSFVTIQFDGPIEGSGSTLTTILNHLGSFLIVCSLFNTLAQQTEVDMQPEVISTTVREAAAIVGHTVTVDDCSTDSVFNFHKVQFLKRSPFYNNGKWLPYTNLGCILRKFGSIDDDLSYRQLGLENAEFISMSHEARCEKFLSAVVAGWVHEPTNPILYSMRSRFRSVVSHEVIALHKHDSLLHVFDKEQELVDYSNLNNTDAIMARYGLSYDEIDELADVISNIKIGQHIRTSAFAKIMHVDYGVKFDEM